MESQIVRPGHLTAHQTARVLGITLGGVRKLVERGQLDRAPGGTERQPWFAAAAVAALAAKRAPAKVA